MNYSKTYEITLTPDEHGSGGDSKKALVNALLDLANTIKNRNDMPLTGATHFETADRSKVTIK